MTLLLVDEAARVDDEVFEAMMPVLATGGGRLWLMSTPNGRRGFFYDAWEYEGEEWMRVSVPATECPRLSADFLASERKRKRERMFRQEYLCEFVDRDDGFIPGETVEEAYVLAPDLGIEAAKLLSREFFLGLDLGKRQDHSALAVVERRVEVTPLNRVTYQYERQRRLRVRELEELPIGMAYSVVAQLVAGRVRELSKEGRCEVVVDATGVGGAVLEVLGEALGMGVQASCLMVPVVITGGETEGASGGVQHVPKGHLMSVLEVMLSVRELKIMGGSEGAEVLRKQLRVMDPEKWTGSLSGTAALKIEESQCREPARTTPRA